jgi:AcrR family transcriptional regulator
MEAKRDPQTPPRRTEILDAAQRLVASKGYEQMTIEDILTETGMSKGAFYHYFDSKADLLHALVTRMREETCAFLQPVLEDPGLTAIQKLQRWFDSAAQWKSARRDYLLSLLQVWYHDDNAVVRQKLRADVSAWLAPLLAPVVRQGIDEGVFATRHPDHAGQVVFSLLYELGDSLAAKLLLRARGGEQAFDESLEIVAAYTDAIERTLGAPTDCLSLIEPEALREWTSPHPVPGPAMVGSSA